MSTNHTPGPWKVAHMSASSDDIREAHFAVKAGKHEMTAFAEQEANARLIAAAPDLLAALEQFVAVDLSEIVRFFNSHGESAPSAVAFAQEQARAALARVAMTARGEDRP